MQCALCFSLPRNFPRARKPRQERSIATKKQTTPYTSKRYQANSFKNLKNPGKSRKAWEIVLGKHGKSREGMGNPGKAWAIPGTHWKSRESIGNPRKALEIPGKYWKSRDSMGNSRIAWKIPGKPGKIPGKAVKSWEMLLKPGKSRAFFLVYI